MDARQQIQERTFQSLKNSLRLVDDSEHTASETLQELAQQREALERTENSLDTINTLTRATQKHLKSMRSMFSGFFGGSSSTPAIEAPAPTPVGTNLGIRQPVQSGQQQKISNNIDVFDGLASTTAIRTSQATNKLDPRSDNTLVGGLDELGNGLSRLKSMALILGNEIEDQNSMIERIGQKAERANDTIKHQNRQMDRILKG